MISVIITIYRQLDDLHLVLLGLDKQTNKNFEVIIAEDDDSKEIKEYIDKNKNLYTYDISHVSQEDKGFRKTKILNKALGVARGEYIVFLDGDCIPHKRFIEIYDLYLTPKTVCIGRRCYLNNKISQVLRVNGNLSSLTFFNILFNGNNLDNAFCKTWLKPIINTKRTIIGCNWGVAKSALIDINGFDEDYTGWGCEDKDIDWRLRASGKYSFINIKHQAIIYHLYHKPSADGEEQRIANLFLDKKINDGLIFCNNGVRKI